MSDIPSKRWAAGFAILFGVLLVLSASGYARGGTFGPDWKEFRSLWSMVFPILLLGFGLLWIGCYLLHRSRRRRTWATANTSFSFFACHLIIFFFADVEEDRFLDRHAGIGGAVHEDRDFPFLGGFTMIREADGEAYCMD